MAITESICQFGPIKTEYCLAFLGLDYKYYLLIIPLSLIIGLILYSVYLKSRNIELKFKNFLFRALILSSVVFIIVLLIIILLLPLLQRQ